MIDLFNVSKRFNPGRSNEFTAVDGVTLSLAPGRLTVLKGPSGSGKTTLLTLIGCMARPTSGRILLRGFRVPGIPGGDASGEIEVTSLPERFLTGIRRETFGFIFQQFNLVRGIDVLENVMLPAYPVGGSRPAVREKALGLLKTFDLARHAGSRVDWLSGGEMQRVAIARALVNDPSIVIADEPTAHLDSHLSREFMEIVGSFKAEGKTVLIASHDPIVYDSALTDAVVELRDGRIVGDGRHG